MDGAHFRHFATPTLEDGAVEVSGHFHPKARLRANGRRISRRCFLQDSRRIILPAFGAYTGGLDATDTVFDGLLESGASALLCARDGVRAIPRRSLVEG